MQFFDSLGRPAAYLCGCLLFCYWAWWVCSPLPFYPDGVDWGQYIMGAEYLWRWTPALTYPDWRHPLYPYLLGLGAVESYAQSARMLNGLGTLLGMSAFAWLGHRSRHPWLGVLGMAMWICHPLVEDARDWINPYLLWGGVIGAWMSSFWTLCADLKTSKSTMLLWSGLGTGFFGACALLLDGRSMWLAGLVIVCLLMQRWMKMAYLLTGLWLGVLGIEFLLLERYKIEVHGLWTQLELQRAYLFRENMALQLFPPTEQATTVVASCMGNPSHLWPIHWSCAVDLAVGNVVAWSRWGLLPPWYLWPLLILPLFVRQNRNWMLAIGLPVSILVPLLLSGLVWQPPRYLFWTVWLWLAGLVWGIHSLRKLCMGRSSKYLVSVGVMSALGHWLWAAPMLNSSDKPKDWPTTGRLVSEQVGAMVLDCTGRGYTMSQLSSHRPLDWSLVTTQTDCIDTIFASDAEGWGVDTILSERRFAAPDGWTLETGFDFNSGVVWMYRRERIQ